jgi:aminoglycoside phosphotransferase (APT) family kinase protein
MTSPGQPDLLALRQVVRAISPDLQLVASRALTGGVSAQVTAFDAESPGGGLQRFVLRQYGAANLRSDPHVAAHEFRLLALLHTAGLPVPRPCHADESCTTLPVPYLVIEFIEGAAVLDTAQLIVPLPAFAGQLASVLVQLHTAGFGRADAPYLADMRAIAGRKITAKPTSPDDALSETGGTGAKLAAGAG